MHIMSSLCVCGVVQKKPILVPSSSSSSEDDDLPATGIGTSRTSWKSSFPPMSERHSTSLPSNDMPSTSMESIEVRNCV